MRRPAPEPDRQIARERVRAMPDKTLDAMRTIGTYRVVDARELDPGVVRRLRANGLAQTRRVLVQHAKRSMTAVSLTREGRRALDAHWAGRDEQRYFAGFGHPSDLEHDMAVYPACREHVERIEASGGRVTRIVTSDEFKSGASARMNRPGRESIAQRRAGAARELGLRTSRSGRLAIPDARIEYQDADGRDRQEDVEVVTRHYSQARVASLAKSGFRIHSADGPRKMITDDHRLGWL